jgi:hypothetical protein
MIARVAVWEPMPDDERQWVIDAAKTVPGVLNGYHLLDPVTGNGLSIALFEDDVDVAQVKARSPRKPSRSAGMTSRARLLCRRPSTRSYEGAELADTHCHRRGQRKPE